MPSRKKRAPKRPNDNRTSPQSKGERPSAPRWRVVENVIAAIERVDGHAGRWNVSQNVMVAQKHSQRRRQVDVLAVCPSGTRTFKVGIDVKDVRAPLDIEDMEQLCAKGRALVLDRYVVISTSGFTEAALEEAERHRVEAVTLRSREFAKVFALTQMDLTNVRLESFGMQFDPTAGLPLGTRAERPWIELEDRSVCLDTLTEPYVHARLQGNPEEADGASRSLRIVDTAQYWKRAHLDGHTCVPPREIVVRWSVQRTVSTGHTFAMEDGREAFSFLLPVGNTERQVTLVAVPNDQGHTLSIAVGETAPSRRNG